MVRYVKGYTDMLGADEGSGDCVKLSRYKTKGVELRMEED
jgi:hypothetical protein